MQGLHLTADLHGCTCDARWLTDAAALGAACVQAVRAAGLTPVGQLLHGFEPTAAGPGGVTATVAGWRDHAPRLFPLPHPSWRNNAFLRRNPWFESDLLPAARDAVEAALGDG